MSEIELKAREILAAQYERIGNHNAASDARRGLYQPEIAAVVAALAPQWQPIESLLTDELVITWHDFGGINQNTASRHYGKKGYSLIQQRFGGRLFPSEACETGFVSHWQPLPAPPEVEG